MKLKCTALGSYVMTAKPSQRGNDDSEVFQIQGLSRTSYIKFQNFQGPIPFSRTIQVLENGEKIFKAVWPPCLICAKDTGKGIHLVYESDCCTFTSKIKTGDFAPLPLAKFPVAPAQSAPIT